MAALLEVVCVGEALVDFLPGDLGRRVEDVLQWTPCSGGSPANVAVGVARLGGRSAMIGTVGQDPFGTFLLQRLRQENVDVKRLRATDEGRTGLVFISLSETGERTFAFYRTRSAELFLKPSDVAGLSWEAIRALHCGSNSLLWDDARAAVFQAVAEAGRAGALVSCDPNLRLHMWPRPAELRSLLDRLLPQCTLVKLAEDEVEFVTGLKDAHDALLALTERGVALPIVTLGPRGAVFAFRGEVVHVPAPEVEVIDSTGAGDGFVAGLLVALMRRFGSRAELLTTSAAELQPLVAFGCFVGSRVVRRLGAVEGLPRWEEAAAALPSELRR